MVVAYLYDLGKIAVAKVRVIVHGLLPWNFLHSEMAFSSSNCALRLGKHLVPLERTDVIMCSCGKVFYERHPGEGKRWAGIYEEVKKAVDETAAKGK